MAGNDRKEFLTDLPENYDAYQEASQNGYQNSASNGYQNGSPKGYQDNFQNRFQDDYTNENPYYFNNTGYSQEQWQAMSYPVSTAPLRQGFAIASMILGILSIVLCCIMGCILALPGIILGIISLATKRDGTGMAIAGIITSALGIVLGICMIFIYVAAYKDYKASYSSGLDRNNKTFNYNYSFNTDDFDYTFDY